MRNFLVLLLVFVSLVALTNIKPVKALTTTDITTVAGGWGDATVPNETTEADRRLGENVVFSRIARNEVITIGNGTGTAVTCRDVTSGATNAKMILGAPTGTGVKAPFQIEIYNPNSGNSYHMKNYAKTGTSIVVANSDTYPKMVFDTNGIWKKTFFSEPNFVILPVTTTASTLGVTVWTK